MNVREELLAEWYQLLVNLWTAIGKPVDEDRLRLYGREFGAVPYGLLDKALARVRRTQSWLVVPTIGEIWRAIDIELHEANCTSAEEWADQLWGNFLTDARKYARNVPLPEYNNQR
jgi:hypothetical protein